MAGIDKPTIIQGPALVTYGGQTFWSKGNIIVKPVQKRFGIEASAFGKLEDRNTDLRIEVTFEPAGQFTNELAAVLWPYAASAPGTPLFTGTDAPLVVWGRDGTKLTLKTAALTQMPNLRFGTTKTSLGPVKFTALVGNSAAPETLASYWAWATAAYPGDTGFSTAEIFTGKAVSLWGSSPWDAFETESGWEFAFQLETTDVMVDGLGTVGMILKSVGATASCIPVGPTAAQVLAALHASLAPGAHNAGANLTVRGSVAGSPVIGMEAMLTDADAGYGVDRKRVGQCSWKAWRTFTAYDAGPPVVPAAMNPLWAMTEYSF